MSQRNHRATRTQEYRGCHTVCEMVCYKNTRIQYRGCRAILYVRGRPGLLQEHKKPVFTRILTTECAIYYCRLRLTEWCMRDGGWSVVGDWPPVWPVVGGSTSTHNTVCYLLLCVVGDHESDQPLTCATCATTPAESRPPWEIQRQRNQRRVNSTALIIKETTILSYVLIFVWGNLEPAAYQL